MVIDLKILPSERFDYLCDRVEGLVKEGNLMKAQNILKNYQNHGYDVAMLRDYYKTWVRQYHAGDYV